MFDALDSAREELKRADHLFYVSLKYTRTVDVIKSIIERLINACSFSIEALLYFLQSKGQLSSVPELPRQRIELVKTYFAQDPPVQEYVNFFIFLRKVDKAPFQRKQEFRRHVTMLTEVDGTKLDIKIDTVKEYFEKIKSFVSYVEKIIEVKEETA